MKRELISTAVWLMLASYAGLVPGTGSAEAQSVPNGNRAENSEILQELKALRAALEETRSEVVRSRDEIRALRSAVENLQEKVAVSPELGSVATQTQAAPENEQLELLNARVEEHQQTKVESASKFRLKLSGMLLFNAFATAGKVDELDMPRVALNRPYDSPHGTIGASMRNSIIGLTGYGPTVAGARTSADLQMDFFGGIPAGYAGSASGLARLRLGRVRFDWTDTSIIGGMDALFVSPNSPATYMTVAEPGLAAAGNLWSWSPSIRVEHRFEARQATYRIEAGVIDPIGFAAYGQAVRYPSPGESSRQPAYALRLSSASHNEGRRMVFGVSGLYSPQRFANGSSIAAWDGAVDWQIPVFSHLEFSGELFTGRALDGFGGLGVATTNAQSAYYYSYFSAPALARIRDTGGWGQAKWRFDARQEVNLAAGYGGRYSKALRDAAVGDVYLLSVPARNQTLFANYILRPRSDLLLSVEYRRLKTYAVNGPANTADRVGVAVGYLF